MKKEYVKPTVRSHELRCSRMIAQSLDTKSLHIMRRGADSGSSSSYDPEDDSNEYAMPEWAD
jgi:hypothetical protein